MSACQEVRGQFLVIDARHFNVDVDAVEHGAGDTLLVTGDHRIGAGALFDRITVVAARAGIHTI